MTDIPPTHDYVAKRPCGCVCGAIADHPLTKRDIGRALSDWIKHGCTIERVTTDYVREHLWVCRLGVDFDTCEGETPLPVQLPLMED